MRLIENPQIHAHMICGIPHPVRKGMLIDHPIHSPTMVKSTPITVERGDSNVNDDKIIP